MLQIESSSLFAEDWLQSRSEGEPDEIQRSTSETGAWPASLGGRRIFAKWYPTSAHERAQVEMESAGTDLHPAIVPMLQAVACSDGLV